MSETKSPIDTQAFDYCASSPDGQHCNKWYVYQNCTHCGVGEADDQVLSTADATVQVGSDDENEIHQLRQENQALREGILLLNPDAVLQEHGALLDEITALKKKLEKLSLTANRYEWLLDGVRESYIWDYVLSDDDKEQGSDLESVIDARLAQQSMPMPRAGRDRPGYLSQDILDRAAKAGEDRLAERVNQNKT